MADCDACGGSGLFESFLPSGSPGGQRICPKCQRTGKIPDLAELVSELEMLRDYAGAQPLMSDFQNAGQMREALKQARQALQEMSAIAGWQLDSTTHPLTCGISSQHSSLVPTWQEHKLVLYCADCGYLQENIPNVVKQWTAWTERPRWPFDGHPYGGHTDPAESDRG
jgi:hypothetical protein